MFIGLIGFCEFINSIECDKKWWNWQNDRIKITIKKKKFIREERKWYW